MKFRQTKRSGCDSQIASYYIWFSTILFLSEVQECISWFLVHPGCLQNPHLKLHDRDLGQAQTGRGSQ